MKSFISKAALAAFAFFTLFGTANADFGVGVRAGTLGLGVEGRWSPIPWFDVRAGINSYDYDNDGMEAGIDYDATLALDSYYATGNIKFPLSPMRLTAGAFSNKNEVLLASKDIGGGTFDIGNSSFSAADVGTLQAVASFDDFAPYVGLGFDFEVFGKVGLNFDFGVLWQGEAGVFLEATGLPDAPAAVQAQLLPELETERLELEDALDDYKAWPVVSLAFIYNF